jgi:hypothetical protein
LAVSFRVVSVRDATNPQPLAWLERADAVDAALARCHREDPRRRRAQE